MGVTINQVEDLAGRRVGVQSGSVYQEWLQRSLVDTGLTLSQFGVLEVLYHKGPLCQRDIGQKILKTSGNMTMVIDNLEKRELVVREKNPADRRRMSVKLTERGLDLIQALFPTHAAVAAETFAVLESNELATLGKLLKKIGKANAAMATAYSCLKFNPTFICNLGSAGATHSGYNLGDIFHVQKIIEPDRPDLKTGKPCVHQPDLLAGFKTTILATNDRAVLDPKERKAISKHAGLIDMEGASVVQACRTFKKNCYLFKFVSDTPDHTRDQDIVDHIRRYRKKFYGFFTDSIKPML